MIEKLKQILKDSDPSGSKLVFTEKDSKDLMSRCITKEKEYKQKNDSKITPLHRIAFFCYSIIEDIASGYPIKMQYNKNNLDGKITSYLAVCTASEILELNLIEDDIKSIAISFLAAFELKNLSIDMIMLAFGNKSQCS